MSAQAGDTVRQHPYEPVDDGWSVIPSRQLVERGLIRAVNASMLWPHGLSLVVVAGTLGPIRTRLEAEGLDDEAVGRVLALVPDHWLVVQQTDEPVESGLSEKLAAERDAAWAAWLEERHEAMS